MALFVEKPAMMRQRNSDNAPRPRHDQVAHVRPQTRVIVLAKTPTGMGPRTRLAHNIGAPDAALVYHRLLERTLRHLERGDVFPVVAVPPRAAEFRTLAQRGAGAHGGSGARRSRPAHRIGGGAGHAGPCIVVDSDTPDIDALLVRPRGRRHWVCTTSCSGRRGTVDTIWLVCARRVCVPLVQGCALGHVACARRHARARFPSIGRWACCLCLPMRTTSR